MTSPTPTLPAKKTTSARIAGWMTIIFAIWLIYILSPSAKKIFAAAEKSAPTVMSAAGSVFTSSGKPAQKAGDMPAITLGCANEKDAYAPPLQNTNKLLLILPKAIGDCPTNWQRRPLEGTQAFFSDPDGRVLVQKSYDDGTIGEWEEDNPLRREMIWTRYITARRYKNISGREVKIIITLR